jgi:hypothetical protein
MRLCSCDHRYRWERLSVFRVVTGLAVISEIEQSDRIRCSIAMRLGWPQHLQASRLLELAPDDQRGLALALMGMALLILVEDLAGQES